jgi:hypothetical protein
MKTALQIDISYDQVLSLVKQLPNKDKLKLTKELEKEGIQSKLTRLLAAFETKEISMATINKEVEIVRQNIYEKTSH